MNPTWLPKGFPSLSNEKNCLFSNVQWAYVVSMHFSGTPSRTSWMTFALTRSMWTRCGFSLEGHVKVGSRSLTGFASSGSKRKCCPLTLGPMVARISAGCVPNSRDMVLRRAFTAIRVVPRHPAWTAPTAPKQWGEKHVDDENYLINDCFIIIDFYVSLTTWNDELKKKPKQMV